MRFPFPRGGTANDLRVRKIYCVAFALGSPRREKLLPAKERKKESQRSASATRKHTIFVDWLARAITSQSVFRYQKYSPYERSLSVIILLTIPVKRKRLRRRSIGKFTRARALSHLITSNENTPEEKERNRNLGSSPPSLDRAHRRRTRRTVRSAPVRS